MKKGHKPGYRLMRNREAVQRQCRMFINNLSVLGDVESDELFAMLSKEAESWGLELKTTHRHADGSVHAVPVKIQFVRRDETMEDHVNEDGNWRKSNGN